MNSRLLPPASKNALILIVEDEPEIAEILVAYFAKEGFHTAHARNGRAGLEMHERLKPDLMILDIQMPEVDGWQVLGQVRMRGSTPVIMLTAMEQDVDKLMGLRLGADDYVVKPFNAWEVVARAEGILRRTQHTASSTKKVIRFAPFEVDLETHDATVEIDGKRTTLSLTPTEFKLLTRLLEAPRRVFTRDELTVHCLQEGEQLLRAVDSHLSNLRKKLEETGLQGVPVTVRGVGYRLWTAL